MGPDHSQLIRDARHHARHTFVAHHIDAAACVQSGDYAHARFTYDPRAHFRRANTAGHAGIAAAAARAVTAIEGARDVCRRCALEGGDEAGAAARAYFEGTLLPELAASIAAVDALR